VQIPDYLNVKDTNLVEILPEIEHPETDLFLIYEKKGRMSRKSNSYLTTFPRLTANLFRNNNWTKLVMELVLPRLTFFIKSSI
jgi:hypothetical protein